MRYFEKLRQDWIVEMIHIYRFINRDHISRKFGVTTAIASHDLQRVIARNPQLMRYNTTKKCYELWVEN